MNNPKQLPYSDRLAILMSIPAALIWIGVLGFLWKWCDAWAAGRLEPGTDTSWMVLYILFGVGVLASLFGVVLTAQAWRGRSTRRRQVVSLVVGALTLWAVAGD